MNSEQEPPKVTVLDCEESITVVNPQTTYIHGDAVAELDYLLKLQVETGQANDNDIIYLIIEDISLIEEAARHVGIHKLIGSRILYTTTKSEIEKEKDIITAATPAPIAPYIREQALTKWLRKCRITREQRKRRYMNSCPSLAVFSHYVLTVLSRKYAQLIAHSLQNLLEGVDWNKDLYNCIARYRDLLNPQSLENWIDKQQPLGTVGTYGGGQVSLGSLLDTCKGGIGLYVVLQMNFHAGLINPEQKGYGDVEAAILGVLESLRDGKGSIERIFLILSDKQKNISDWDHARNLMKRLKSRYKDLEVDLCLIREKSLDSLECELGYTPTMDCGLVLVLYDFGKSLINKLFEIVSKKHRDSFLLVMPRSTYKTKDDVNNGRAFEAISVSSIIDKNKNKIDYKKLDYYLNNPSLLVPLKLVVDMLEV